LPAEMEPHCPNGRDPEGTRSVGECASVRRAQYGVDRWLHRHGLPQEPLPVLAAGHRYSGQWGCQLDTIDDHPAEPGLPIRSLDRRWRGGWGAETSLSTRQNAT